MHPFTNTATAAARKAGRLFDQSLERLASIKITEKRHAIFVNNLSKMAEESIVTHIRKAYPEHNILTKHMVYQVEKLTLNILNESDFIWVINPLDGTENFIRSVPYYAISIALQIKGRLEHAVIYDLIHKEIFTASRGQGAFANNKRIRVATRTKLETCVIGTGFPSHQKAVCSDFIKTFEAVFYACGDIRRNGSISLDLAYVASGRLDAFWEFQLNPWKMASGILLLQEAGALVVDFRGAENYMKSGNVIVGNPKLVKLLNKLIYNSLIMPSA